MRSAAGEGDSRGLGLVIGGLRIVALGTLFAATCGVWSTTTATVTRTSTATATPGAVAAAGVPVSLTVQNRGEAADRLLGASSPIAERIEVQQTRLVQGRRVIQALPAGIEIPGLTTLTFEPGTRHLMLIGLRMSLVQGETFPLALRFQSAGEVMVTARVRRKVDAAGVPPIPPACAGDLCIVFASAPPAPAG